MLLVTSLCRCYVVLSLPPATYAGSSVVRDRALSLMFAGHSVVTVQFYDHCKSVVVLEVVVVRVASGPAQARWAVLLLAEGEGAGSDGHSAELLS